MCGILVATMTTENENQRRGKQNSKSLKKKNTVEKILNVFDSSIEDFLELF